MNVKVSYSEINSFISRKLHHPIRVNYSSNGKMDVIYTLKKTIPVFGEVSKDISMSLSVYSVYSDSVVLKADSGAVVGLFMPMILNSLADKNNLDFLSAADDKITVRLNRIPGASSALKVISLNGLSFLNDGIEARIALN